MPLKYASTAISARIWDVFVSSWRRFLWKVRSPVRDIVPSADISTDSALRNLSPSPASLNSSSLAVGSGYLKHLSEPSSNL